MGIPDCPPGAHSLTGGHVGRCGPEGHLACECGKARGEEERALLAGVTKEGFVEEPRLGLGSSRWVGFHRVGAKMTHNADGGAITVPM